jgi:hypothetical protein
MSYSIPRISCKTPVLCLLYSGYRTRLYLYVILCTIQCVVYLRTKDISFVMCISLGAVHSINIRSILDLD